MIEHSKNNCGSFDWKIFDVNLSLYFSKMGQNTDVWKIASFVS